MNIALVEDEKIHQEYICKFLKKASEESRIPLSVQIFNSSNAFLFSWEDNCMDAVLLDIKMSGMNGFELAKTIRKKDRNIPIAFITGEKDYVFDGYQLDACGYLLKPINQEDVTKLVKKIREKVQEGTPKLSVKTKDGVVTLYEDELIYIESQDHLTNLICEQGLYETGKKFGEWEEVFTSKSFFKPHRCYLIHLGHISRITKKDCIMINGKSIPISRGRWEDLMKAYLNYQREEVI